MIILTASVILVIIALIVLLLILIRNEFILSRKRLLVKQLREKLEEWNTTKDPKIIKENEAIIKELQSLKII